MSIVNDTNDLSFKSGDVIWHLIDNNDYMPFFQCKTFLVRLFDLTKKYSKILFEIKSMMMIHQG
jgi:hypothetical protein